ncbi:hypothetical protein D3C78_1207710 [compost metagenome]
MPGRRGELHAAPAVLEFAGRQLLHLTAELHQLASQAGQAGVVDHLEAHEIHARLVGLAQHQRELVGLGPGLEVDPALLVAVDLNQAQQIDVVFQGLDHVKHAQLHVARTHHTFFHNDAFCLCCESSVYSLHGFC